MPNTQPIVLAILDGWGHSTETLHNAIYSASTPNWDGLLANYPHTLLSASGTDVGLPENQMGNSEVGHLTIGAGRTIPQDLALIDNAIQSEEFFANKCLNQTASLAKQNSSTIHLIGLVSDGGVHSHQEHLFALIRLLARQCISNVAIHVILDGRDTAPKSAKASLIKLQRILDELNTGYIATISGRYFAMDRDSRLDRTELAVHAIRDSNAKYSAKDAITALEMAYSRDETDEFVSPTIIKSKTIEPEDILVYFNFRADRMRQLCRALPSKHAISFTEYATDLDFSIAFTKPQLTNVLGEYLAKHNLSQLRIAETEKYAHVTFFLNGGQEQSYPQEQRIMIPSPKISTYDLQPEMSAREITEQICNAISSQQFAVIICNFANADMVGHTGKFQESCKAITCIDYCLGRITKHLQQVSGEMLITADHGNAETMYNAETNQVHTSHTTSLVPLVYYGKRFRKFKSQGTLADVAPTLLQLLSLDKPKEMTGQALLDD